MKLKNKFTNILPKQKFDRLSRTLIMIAVAMILVAGFRLSASTTAATFSPAAKITANDGAAGDVFGGSVAISGDTVIAGAHEDRIGGNASQGSAYIFVRGANGLWTQQAKLTAADGAANDFFGGSVGISGDTVIVGASGDDIGANDAQGSAYVFVRTGTTWTVQDKLLANDGADTDIFGESVAIAGDTAVVGAIFDTVGGNSRQGSAYVYVRNGGAWTQQERLTAGDGAVNDFFGKSVAIGSNTVIVGAHQDDVGGDVDRGSAYVFFRSGTTWTQQQKLTASDGVEGDEFGRSVDIAVAVDTVIVGAPEDGIGGTIQRGSAYVFTRSGTTWTQQQKLIASDGDASDFFGYSVSIFSNTAVIGAIFDDIGSSVSQGSAYVFTRSGTSWTERQKLTAFDGDANDFFGGSVALSTNTVIVGAYADTNGSAYIFRLGSKPFDFDDDGKTDLSIFRPSVGEWWYLKSSTGGNAAAQFGAGTDKIAPGDFTGDSKTDIAFWRPSTGFWFVLRSEDFSFYSFPFGTNGDLSAPADYDGDLKTDAAVFRPSTSTWYINNSGGGTVIQQFGQSGDVPVAADYDADGKADIAIYRVSLGEWWIQRSAAGTIAFQFGNSADKPAQGDYTGDGKADVAIFRPSTGEWFVLRSEDQSYYSFPFGTNGDLPAPGDYDNDGKFDATVFRPSNSTWYAQRTTAGTLIQTFGVNGDRPVPNAFVP